MAKNHNNFKFDIPIPIIILAYIAYWPVGIVLTVLRSISIPTNQSGSGTDRREIREEYSRAYRKQQKKQKKRKISGGFLAAMIGGVLASLVGFAEITSSHSILYFLENALPWIAAAIACFVGAKLIKNRDVRLNRIRTIIGNRESINLTKLAAASDESLKRIRKDVQKLIDKGEFGENAYIDLGTNNFMRNSYAEPDEPEAFDYRTVYGDLLKKDKKAEKKTEVREEPVQAENSENTAETDDFGKIIREIRRLNDDIKDIAVSYRIDRIEEHTKNIFEYVTDHPEAMPQIRTFMNYYLPTTLKLLESYSRIERVGVAGENMKKSKENIENILDLLVAGFEQQVDQLFKSESIDISSDISVLETMMQKDGLSTGKNNFDLASFVEQYSNEISDDLSGGAAVQKKPE